MTSSVKKNIWEFYLNNLFICWGVNVPFVVVPPPKKKVLTWWFMTQWIEIEIETKSLNYNFSYQNFQELNSLGITTQWAQWIANLIVWKPTSSSLTRIRAYPTGPWAQWAYCFERIWCQGWPNYKVGWTLIPVLLLKIGAQFIVSALGSLEENLALLARVCLLKKQRLQNQISTKLCKSLDC